MRQSYRWPQFLRWQQEPPSLALQHDGNHFGGALQVEDTRVQNEVIQVSITWMLVVKRLEVAGTPGSGVPRIAEEDTVELSRDSVLSPPAFSGDGRSIYFNNSRIFTHRKTTICFIPKFITATTPVVVAALKDFVHVPDLF